MGRDKLSANPVDALRKKEKEKERAKNKKLRAEKFERDFQRLGEDDAMQKRALVLDRNKKRPGEEVSHKAKTDLERMDKMFKKHGEKMEEKWLKKSIVEEKKQQVQRVKNVKDNAMFSIYYDREKNPLGLAPPGQPMLYRHPDGETRPTPPFQKSSSSSSSQPFRPPPGAPGSKEPKKRQRNESSDSDSSDDETPVPPPCPPPPENAPPGFSYNPTTMFLKEITLKQQQKAEEEAKNPTYQRQPVIRSKRPFPPSAPSDDASNKKNWQDVIAESKLEERLAKLRQETADAVAHAVKEKTADEQNDNTTPGEAPTIKAAASSLTRTPTVKKPTSFVPTVLRTKTTRTDNITPQVTAFSLGVGMENALLTNAEKLQREKNRRDALALKAMDIETAFNSFMKDA